MIYSSVLQENFIKQFIQSKYERVMILRWILYNRHGWTPSQYGGWIEAGRMVFLFEYPDIDPSVVAVRYITWMVDKMEELVAGLDKSLQV